MALFKRNKTTIDDAVMPQELQDYYEAETRERTWMAWMLGLATLVITVVIALGLFYGGRFAYRKIRGSDSKQTAVQQDNQSEDEDADEADEENEEQTASAPATSEPAQTAAPTSTPNTSSTTTNTPRTATPQPSTMPNTGPTDTIALFVVVSVLAYVVHRRFLTD